MSDERAIEVTQLSQPPPGQSTQVSLGYFEPHQLVELSKHGRLYLLADGAGGAASGPVAGQYAVKKILHAFFTAGTPDVKTRLLQTIRQANSDIFERNNQHPERRPMAATLVAALIHNSKLVVANVGDSRVYVVWDQDIEQLCPEPAPQSKATGTPKESDAPDESDKLDAPDESEKKQNGDTPQPLHPPPSLGLKKEINVDTYSRRLFPGDIVILCSGGLTGYLTEKEIVRAINRHSPHQAIQRLIALAGERGNRDHAAISIIRVLSSPVSARPPAQRALPAEPKWSDWDVPPQPQTKPLAPSSPPSGQADAPAKPRFTPPLPLNNRPTRYRTGCIVAAVVGIVLCAALLLAGRYLLTAQAVANVPVLGNVQAALSQSSQLPVAGSPATPAQPDTALEESTKVPTFTPTPQPTQPPAEATLVSQNNSPIATPETTFNSPVSTPTSGSQGDSLATATPPPATPTPSPTPLPTIEVPPDCTNKARFRRDVTIPDGTQLAPAESFEKVWLVQNAGTCPWGPGYTVRLIGGDTMGANNQTPLVEVTPPDTNGEISVSMIAPAAPGSYRGDWQLFDLNGEPFGPEMYLEIEVVAPDPTQVEAANLETLYNFIEQADQAAWSTGQTSYTLIESEISEELELPAPEGLVARGQATLRGNVKSSHNVLLTYPHREAGFIEGTYTVDTPLQPTDALAFTVGFIRLLILSDDGVTFEVLFTPDEGEEQVVLSRTVQYADSPVTEIQPLTGIAPGATGTFTLRVQGGESLNQDWAVWIDARLVRLPGEQ